MSNQSRSPLTPVELAKRAQVFMASRAVETNICRRYWKYGRSLWQEDAPELTRMVQAFAKIIETAEFDERIRKLEEALRK